VVAVVSFYRQGRKAFRSGAGRTQHPLDNPPGHAAGAVPVPLTTLKPGRYTCQVSVIDETAKKFDSCARRWWFCRRGNHAASPRIQ